MQATTIVLLTLIFYKALLLGVGFWASKRVKTESDFFLAGQGLGAWTAGLSYAASTSSAWVLLGFTGIVYSKGLIGLWLIPGIFGGYVMTWLVMGPRLNAETAERGYLTVVDFIVADVAPKWARLIGFACAAMILFCFVFYISSQFQAAGNALTEVFGLSAVKSILIGAAVILVYCLAGGFLAASITDALQALVMMLACILVPLAAVQAAGGLGEIIATLKTQETASYFSLTGEAVGILGIGAAMGLVLSAVMSTVDSLLLAAASAVSHDLGVTYRDPRKALLAGRLAMVFVAGIAVLMTLYLPKDIFSRVLFSWVALGAAFGPVILTKCLGWRVQGGFIFAAIICGFFTAVIFANIDGTAADVIEKWASWAIGLVILLLGRRHPNR